MIRAAALAAAILAAAGQAGCDSPRAAPCQGERVATFSFAAESAGGNCPFAPDGGLSFTATLAYDSETSAVLCLDRPDALPLQGGREGDHVTLSSPATAANLASCACSVEVRESVEGDVLRDQGGGPSGFDGKIRNAFSATDGGTNCEREGSADGGPRCGVPCELVWQLRVVGS